MSKSSTWSINQLDRENADGFVFTAHYTVNVTDGTYKAGAYGSVGFERPETLVPYADLTEEVVLGWVKEAIGGAEKVSGIETQLEAVVDEQKNPTKSTGLPWS